MSVINQVGIIVRYLNSHFKTNFHTIILLDASLDSPISTDTVSLSPLNGGVFPRLGSVRSRVDCGACVAAGRACVRRPGGR